MESTMSKYTLHIKEPIWNGGKACVGISAWRIRHYDIVEVIIDKTAPADGKPYFQGCYRMMTDRVASFPLRPGNPPLYIVPIEKMARVQEVLIRGE